MEITLEQLGTYSGISLVFGTLVFFAARHFIEKQINSDFEIKLQNLKKEHDLELAKFQADINHLKSQENFKFTKLHEKRFEIFEILYFNIASTYFQFRNFFKTDITTGTDDEIINFENQLRDLITEFDEIYTKSKIYLEVDTVKLIDNFQRSLSSAVFNFYTTHPENNSETPEETEKRKRIAVQFLHEKTYPFLKEIEIEFRKIIKDSLSNQ